MPMLTNGNTKLGPAIGAWSTPAKDSCPGMTPSCSLACYAFRYTRRLGIDYSPNSVAIKADDFVAKMTAECQWKRVVRIHVSGDFASELEVRKWFQVMQACPRTTFYAYTRSWRIPEILTKLAITRRLLPNFVLLYSCDRDTGIPDWMDGPTEVAWMAMTNADVPPRRVRVVFRRSTATGMARMGPGRSIVCPAENGIDNGVTCQRCRLCFKEAF